MREQRRTTTVVSNVEINRESTALERMFNLAIQAGKLIQNPHIPFLREHNVRVGFLEREEFLAVLAHLPEAVRPATTFAYITGWRIDSELLSLEWRQVDLVLAQSDWIREDPTRSGKSRNGEGRTFPMTRELREMLEQPLAIAENLQRQLKIVCPRVFHRSADPSRASASHQTRGVFERYNMVSAATSVRLHGLSASWQGTVQEQSNKISDSASKPEISKSLCENS